MADAPGFPQVMIHPQHRAAVVKNFDSTDNLPGAPERFPPIEVHSPDQEEATRARGYLRYGENMPKLAEFSEFPKMMRHPQHVDAVPASQGAQMVDGRLSTYPIPGIPEKFPDATVHDAAEQATWEAKGYEAAGVDDPIAFEKATVAPGKPGDEWPKYIDGVLTQDPDAPPDLTGQYPKWLHFEGGDSVLVQDPAQENAVRVARGGKQPEAVRQPEPPYLAATEERIARAKRVAAEDAEEQAEYAEFRAWKARRDAEPPVTIADAVALENEERATLIALAEETGVHIDKRWGLAKLRETVMGDKAA